MGREHHARFPRRRTPTPTRTRARLSAATGAAFLALLLTALAALPAAAGGDGHRNQAVLAVRTHEKARERVDRLREADALPEAVERAEERRKAVRSDLWDLLRARARASGDPVAVDPSGRSGRRCPFGSRSRAPEQHSTGWTAPTRRYWLSAGYAAKGSRWARRHTGQDFAVDSGTPVYAVGSGVVRVTTCGDGFGNQVLVRHGDGYFTQYAHLSRIDVRRDQRVAAGQRLGLSGASGNVTGPHLHFEVRITPYLGSQVPPLPWLRRKDVQVSGAPALP
ncbi:M23 family metallopeptidase [Streptomyces sp. B21-105]|uniref:M23 family metallopeptidase n=1 Tax=Streptomyces sp. B21-105 TaxID=3039417 RepID=UPI002FF370C2